MPVIVLFRDADEQSRFQSQSTRSTGFDHIVGGGAYLPFAAARVRRSEVERSVSQGRFESVWLDVLCTTCLDRAARHVGMDQVWADFGIYGEGVLIGFADTGLDREHPDFAGRVEGFRDFLDDGQSTDPDGHGTHVASAACGSGAASNGRYQGLAPKSGLLAARVLQKGGAGRMSRVMQGTEWLAASGAGVINLSVGTEVSVVGVDPLSRLCANLVEAGVVVTVAAGNTGPRPRTIGSPGSAPRVITVGATDLLDQVTSFSSRGPTVNGVLKPDLVAPGFQVTGARARGTLLGEIVNESYTRMSGTSMAAPMVAGLSALMLEVSPQLTASEIKAILQLNCASLNLPQTTQGAGLLQAYSSMRSLVAQTQEPEPPKAAPAPDAAAPPPAPAGCLGLGLGRLFGGNRPALQAQRADEDGGPSAAPS